MKKVLGYVDNWNALPGDTLNFKISTYGPAEVRADLVRVICGDSDPDHGIFKEIEIDAPFSGSYAAGTQPIDAGSYAVVAAAPALSRLRSFTVLAWVLPTTPTRGEQGVLTHWAEDGSAGFALMLGGDGSATLRVADGHGGVSEATTGAPLAERRWCLIAGSYDADARTLSVMQMPDTAALERLEGAHGASAAGGFAPAKGALMMAALPAALSNGRPGSRANFNGKIDRPRLVGRALSAAEAMAAAQRIDAHVQDPDVVAAWDLGRDIGTDVIRDLGPNHLDGRLVNLPGRGCKGFNWTGGEQSVRHAPHEYGAIHFHEDDLYDAGWDTTFAYTVPDSLRSGVYAARLRVDGDHWYVTFFVRPPRGTATAKLAFLASTVTYMAYANYHWLFHERFAEATESLWTTMEKTDVFLQEHPEFGLSTYDTHADGSGCRFASRLRPILNMAPTTPTWSFNADTHILGWLDAKGIEYDVITDEDLHAEGLGVLAPYTAVMTGSHPEYYTTPMMEALRAYLAGPGRLIYMGGNGFIWRCAMSEHQPGVVELRRAEDGIRYRDEEPGEYYLQFTGEYGGMWRRLGLPPQALVGVGTIACGFDASGYYRRAEASFDPRAAFIFEGIGSDEIIGDFGFLGGGASGSEIDSVNPMIGTPVHALVVAQSEGHSANTLICPDEIGFHHAAMDGVQNPLVRADMTFFETPGGGAVFSTASIAWAASLPHRGYDNNVSRLTENVVRRFIDDTPFEIPKHGR